MDINARLDGYMVHPLDLFPTNKNILDNLEKISLDTADLDGFKVHPIDLFVNHENPNKNYNLSSAITNNGIFNTQSKYNNGIIPFEKQIKADNIFNQYQNPRNMGVYETQKTPIYNKENNIYNNFPSMMPTENRETFQNNNTFNQNQRITSHFSSLANQSINNIIYPTSMNQKINNINNEIQNSITNNQNNIIKSSITTIQSIPNLKYQFNTNSNIPNVNVQPTIIQNGLNNNIQIPYMQNTPNISGTNIIIQNETNNNLPTTFIQNRQNNNRQTEIIRKEPNINMQISAIEPNTNFQREIFPNIQNINEQKSITQTEPIIGYQRATFQNASNTQERTIIQTEPNINFQRTTFQNAPNTQERTIIQTDPNINFQRTTFQNDPNTQERTIIQTEPNINFQRTTFQNAPNTQERTIIQTVPNINFQRTTFQNAPNINNAKNTIIQIAPNIIQTTSFQNTKNTPQGTIMQTEPSINFHNISNINEQRTINKIEPNISFQSTTFHNDLNKIEQRIVTQTVPTINVQSTTLHNDSNNIEQRIITQTVPTLNARRTTFHNAPYIKEQRPNFTNIPNINDKKENLQIITNQRTIFQNDPNINMQKTQIKNSPYINFQSSIIPNIPPNETTYINYSNQKNYIDKVSQYNNIHNLYNTEHQLRTPYKINSISNNISLITPNNGVNYLPAGASSIRSDNFLKSKPQIEAFEISNIKNYYRSHNNNYLPLFSTHNIDKIYNNNLNKGEALLNNINTTPNMNKPLPYSYASYEPDANDGEDHEPDKINQPNAYLTSSTADIIPKNLFNAKRVINLPKTFNPINASYIVPHNQNNIPIAAKTVISPSQSPIFSPKKTFVISPPKKNIMTNPVISRVITTRPVVENKMPIIGSTYSHIPLNNYNSRTIKRLPTAISRVNYSPRIVSPVNQGVIYSQNNNIPINIHPRSVSKSPIRYNITSFIHNPRQLGTQRNVVFLPRRL